MTSSAAYDIAIAGAGIAGVATAVGLARIGYRVALIDRPHAPAKLANGFDLRTYALTPASMRWLKRLGAAEHWEEQRIAAYRKMRVWDESSDGEIVFDASSVGVEYLGVIIEHNNLLTALSKTAAACAGLDRVEARVTGIETAATQVTIALDDGNRIETALLIACDGSRSAIRGSLGVKVDVEDFRQTAIVCNVESALPHQHVARQRFLSTGPLAFLPLPAANAASIVWTATPEMAARAVTMPDTEFMQWLGQQFDYALGRVTDVSLRRVFPLTALHARRYVCNRVVLLGDAAHVVHPLAGQGLNLGLMDSAALAQVMDGRTDRTLEYPAARLQRFERMRRGENLAMLRATSLLNGLFCNNTPLVSRVRGFGLRAVDHAGLLKSWLILRAMGDAGDVPEPAA